MQGFNLGKEVLLDKGEGSVFLSPHAVVVIYVSLSQKMTKMDVKKVSDEEVKKILNKLIDLVNWSDEC